MPLSLNTIASQIIRDIKLGGLVPTRNEHYGTETIEFRLTENLADLSKDNLNMFKKELEKFSKGISVIPQYTNQGTFRVIVAFNIKLNEGECERLRKEAKPGRKWTLESKSVKKDPSQDDNQSDDSADENIPFIGNNTYSQRFNKK